MSEGRYGIDVLNGLKVADRPFLHRMFQRRHLVVHNGSRVDDEYVRKTRDSSVRLNQVIRPGSQ